MKNNMLMLAFIAIVALFTLTVALYGASAMLLPGNHPAADGGKSHTAPPGTDGYVAPTLRPDGGATALCALSVTAEDPAVKAWTEGKKDVSVASISSDFCEEGASDTWTITFTSGDGQAIACVLSRGSVEVRDAAASPHQRLDPRATIDSDLAWQAMASDGVTADSGVPMTAMMVLKVVGGMPRWDVSYQAPGGYRIVRVNAVDGTVSESTTIGLG